MMTDQTITALTAAATGATIYTQAQAVAVPLPVSAVLTLTGMMAAAFVTWGMFKKATERNETEISMLRDSLREIHNTLSDVRERVSRIEGKLETDR